MFQTLHLTPPTWLPKGIQQATMNEVVIAGVGPDPTQADVHYVLHGNQDLGRSLVPRSLRQWMLNGEFQHGRRRCNRLAITVLLSIIACDGQWLTSGNYVQVVFGAIQQLYEQIGRVVASKGSLMAKQDRGHKLLGSTEALKQVRRTSRSVARQACNVLRWPRLLRTNQEHTVTRDM